MVKRELGKYLIRSFFSVLVFSIIFIGIGFLFERDFFQAYVKWRFYPTKEDADIKGALVLYNKIFSDIHATDGLPLRLNDFPASKPLRHEVYQHLGFLRDQKLILVYDMADLAFIEIKRPGPFTAEVKVFEEWNYIYQKFPSREIARSIKGMGQGFKYLMVKQRGKWLVTDYFPEDIKYEKKKEFYY